MTNQERLQENNNLIKEIRQLLEDKMLVAAGEPKVVEIEFPTKFATASKIYTYKVNSNTILFACNVTSSGVWKYSAKDNSLKQLWDGGYNWDGFYSITNNLVLVATNSGPNPLLVYDIAADEITSTDIYYNGGLNVKKIDDNRFFISTKSSIGKGLAIFDVRTKKARAIRSTSYNYSYFAQMGDYWFIGTNTGADGLLKFNALTEEITMVHSNGSWAYLNVVDDKCYFSSSSSAFKGFYVYDSTNDTVITIDETSYNWAYVFKIEDKIYASNTQSSVAGLYVITDNQLVQVYTEGYGYRYAPVINDRAIITGVQQWALIFDMTNGTFTKITNSYIVLLGNSIVLGNKMLLTPTTTNTSKLMIYNYDTNSLTAASGGGSFSNYGKFKRDGDNCYISTATLKQPVYYYTNADDSVVVIYH